MKASAIATREKHGPGQEEIKEHQAVQHEPGQKGTKEHGAGRGVTGQADTRSKRSRRETSWQMVRRHYHERGWRSPYQRYQEWLAKILGPEAVVLDVGCGRHFPLADYLRGRVREIHGIDPQAPEPGTAPERRTGTTNQTGTGTRPRAGTRARTRAGIRAGTREPDEGASREILRRASVYDIPYGPETFDVVACQSVLEHLEYPQRAFAEIQRVLKPEGRFIFLAANKYDYVSLIARLVPNVFHGFLVRATEGRAEQDTFPTYYRANSKGQIERWAARSGMQVEKLEYLNQFPYALMFSGVLCRLGIAYDEFIGRYPRLQALRGWLLGCLKKPVRKPSSPRETS